MMAELNSSQQHSASVPTSPHSPLLLLPGSKPYKLMLFFSLHAIFHAWFEGLAHAVHQSPAAIFPPSSKPLLTLNALESPVDWQKTSGLSQLECPS